MVTVMISYGHCYDQLWSLLRSVMVTVMISYGHICSKEEDKETITEH